MCHFRPICGPTLNIMLLEAGSIRNLKYFMNQEPSILWWISVTTFTMLFIMNTHKKGGSWVSKIFMVSYWTSIYALNWIWFHGIWILTHGDIPMACWMQVNRDFAANWSWQTSFRSLTIVGRKKLSCSTQWMDS